MSNYHVNLVDRATLEDIPSTKWLAAKSVLRAIAEHANEAEADMAWPGLELLMIETGASESVITRTTNLLAKHEWISKKRRGNSSNLYRVNVAKLKEHQVDRPVAGTVHMGEHLAGMEFAGEEAASSGAPSSGRSTARGRAQQRRTQATRQIDESESSNRRERSVKSTGAIRQSDDRTIREPVGNPHSSTARERDEAPTETCSAAEQWMDGDVSDNDGTNSPEASALELIQSVIPHGHGGYNAKSNHDHAVAAVVAAREVLTDSEITQVLGYGLDAVRNPAALIRTHRTAELLAVVKKRESQVKHPPRAEEVPALWCTNCTGVAVIVTTQDGTRSKIRCSRECSHPRTVAPWVWAHVADNTGTGVEDAASAADNGSGTNNPGDEAPDVQPKFQRPSQLGHDPGEVVAARRRAVSRYANRFTADA